MRAKYKVEPGSKFNLAKFNPNDTSWFASGKKDAEAIYRKHTEALVDYQERLYAEHAHSLLIVLQGIDTAGKDGTIRHVFGDMNPQGVKVASFKQPTPEEADHDFLWRIHKHTPGQGEIVIFNRSHYEDVLAVRVLDIKPKSVWSKRYAHINHWERLLTDEGCTILKFFLLIDKEEQKERLLARLNDPGKQWKLSPTDAKDRALWPRYMEAYQDMLTKTSTAWAPWHVIPSNKKWYRNLVVSEIVKQTLADMKIKRPKPRFDLTGYSIE